MNTIASLRASRAAFSALLLSASGVAMAQSVPIVQPGAPGQASKTLSAEEATKLAASTYTAEDVTFMQGMMVHHQQAVDMAVLVKDRTNTKELVEIAGRIESSQADEIAFMKSWLAERGEPLEDAMMKDHAHHTMMGMASPDQMAALAAASGVEFDQQFLTLMIAHHKGAIDMVDALFDEDGSAADPVLYRFASDIENEQKGEIERMDKLLAGLSADPRSGLAAGFDNAGEAIMNLTKVATLAKPAGFFNPANPADLRPPAAPKKDKKAEGDKEAMGEKAAMDAKPEMMAAKDAPKDGAKPDMAAADPAAAEATPPAREEEDLTEFAERSPLLDFANTDMAFFGDVMVAGSYHGFNIYKLGGVSSRPVAASIAGCRAHRARSMKTASGACASSTFPISPDRCRSAGCRPAGAATRIRSSAPMTSA